MHRVSKCTRTTGICMCQPVLPMQSWGGGGAGVQLCTGADFPPLLMGPCQCGHAGGDVPVGP